MMAKLSNQEIGNKAIEYVMEHLRSKGENPMKQHTGHGPDIISNGKYIDAKGSMTTATNLRMCPQVLDTTEKAGKLKQGTFYIYYVSHMASRHPKLTIFDYNTFQTYKQKEIKWLIQPKQIKKKTSKPFIIDLPKLKSE